MLSRRRARYRYWCNVLRACSARSYAGCQSFSDSCRQARAGSNLIFLHWRVRTSLSTAPRLAASRRAQLFYVAVFANAHGGADAPVVAHQAQNHATQGRDLSTLAPLRAFRARTPEQAWAQRAVGEGVMSCPIIERLRSRFPPLGTGGACDWRARWRSRISSATTFCIVYFFVSRSMASMTRT